MACDHVHVVARLLQRLSFLLHARTAAQRARADDADTLAPHGSTAPLLMPAVRRTPCRRSLVDTATTAEQLRSVRLPRASHAARPADRCTAAAAPRARAHRQAR